MNEQINLYNRYGENIYLEHIKDNDWLLKGQDLSFMRVIFDGEGFTKIHAIDPSGGPYLSVGSKVHNQIISDIVDSKKGFIITLKDEVKEN